VLKGRSLNAVGPPVRRGSDRERRQSVTGERSLAQTATRLPRWAPVDGREDRCVLTHPVTPFAFLGRDAGVRQVKSVDPVLRGLLRKRVEICTWLDGPAKQAHLARLNRMIEEHLDSRRAA
jgi:hypothetical protein